MVKVYVSRVKAKQDGGFIINCPHCGREVLAQPYGIGKVGICAVGRNGNSMHQLKEVFNFLHPLDGNIISELKGEFIIAVDSPLSKLARRLKGISSLLT